MKISRHVTLLTYLLLLTPLVYGSDGDNYRAWEVFAVCAAVLFAARRAPTQPMPQAMPLLLLAYDVLVVLQQFFVPKGDLLFGAKYAVSMTTVFVPALIIQAVRWRPADFAILWDGAIKVLAVVIILNFYSSRLFGIGEIHYGGQGLRAFGYLGDSFSPVLIFPCLYFLLLRKYAWVLTMLIAMTITGGKAALVMLLATGVVYGFVRGGRGIKIAIVAAGCLGIGLVAETTLVVAQMIPAIGYSINTRLVSFELGMEYFLAHPLFGVGINQSMNNAYSAGDAIAQMSGLNNQRYADSQIDNAFIRTMAETGLLGLTILLAFCALLIRRSATALRAASTLPNPRVRAFVTAGSLWTITFIILYQFVGWFEAGHPQMTWLLLIATGSYAAYRSYDGISPSDG